MNWVESSLFNRYEDEINKRTAAENEFVVLKKVSRVAGSGGKVVFIFQGAGLTWRGARVPGAEPTALLSLSLPQDVDAAYIGQMDLHGTVDYLVEEMDFLRHLYEEVR